MGIICLSFVIIPFIFLGKGMNGDMSSTIPTTLYWILFLFNWIISRIKWGTVQRLKVYVTWDSLFLIGHIRGYFLVLMSVGIHSIYNMLTELLHIEVYWNINLAYFGSYFDCYANSSLAFF